MSINNIQDLRDFALNALVKLSQGKITTEEAGVTGKLCENVVSTLKIQLEYAKMLAQEPCIDFLQGDTLPKGKLIEHVKKTNQLQIPNKEVIDKAIQRRK